MNVKKGEQENPEFSSIFPFRVKGNSKAKELEPVMLQKALLKRPFRMESDDNYTPGFAIPTVLDRGYIISPYYEMVQEEVTVHKPSKDSPGLVVPETKTARVQKVYYIIDAHTCAGDGLVLVCRTKSTEHAEQLLEEYLDTIGVHDQYSYDFLYSHSSELMQQLLAQLYDYWPTSQSQISSITIGGKTLSIRVSGRNKYDIRLDEQVDEEIRNKLRNGEYIEKITVKMPVSAAGIKSGQPLPRITINDRGVIGCRANISFENFRAIASFIGHTEKMLHDIVRGRPSKSYRTLEDFLESKKPSNRQIANVQGPPGSGKTSTAQTDIGGKAG